MKFVVIGGDAAGMSAASRAKRQDPSLEVTVLERSRTVSYSACGIPYNISDPRRAVDDLVVRTAQVFREKSGINVLTGHRVDRIDSAGGRVSGSNEDAGGFQIAFDRLLIATGAYPIVPDRPGFDLPGVVVVKTLDDARTIKALLQARPVRTALILGMGYIAMEMAEALVSRGVGVEMAKPRTTLLPWMEPDLSSTVRRELEEHKVVLHTGFELDRIESLNDQLNVIDRNDAALSADLVVVAIGVKPNSHLAVDSGLALGPGGAIAVDRQMCTSQPHIYAAGDCADAYHVVTGQKTWVPLALRANRAGWAVADHLCGKPVSLQGVAGTSVFKVFDLQVARTGLTLQEAEAAGFNPVAVTIKASSRAHAYPGATSIQVHMLGDKTTGRLLGTQMVGYEGVAHRINAPAVALHAGMTVEHFSQSDLAYAPPFGPTWDPMLVAANQLLKKMT